MKIAVFGGTGQTGYLFVRQALTEGHELKVLARTPDKLPEHEHLRIVVGSVEELEKVKETIAGAEAVVSFLGHAKESSDNLLQAAMEKIVQTMKLARVRRLVVMSGAAVEHEKDKPGVMDHVIRWAMGTFAKKVLTDARAAAQVVADSGLEWTLVRAPRLSNKAGGEEVHVGYLGEAGISTQVTRADVGRTILDIVQTDEWAHEMPVVSN